MTELTSRNKANYVGEDGDRGKDAGAPRLDLKKVGPDDVDQDDVDDERSPHGSAWEKAYEPGWFDDGVPTSCLCLLMILLGAMGFVASVYFGMVDIYNVDKHIDDEGNTIAQPSQWEGISADGTGTGVDKNGNWVLAKNFTAFPRVKFPMPPDARPHKCPAKLPKYFMGEQRVSLVIPYLRESYKNIEGTVGSILAHTPPQHLEEIIFISDGNTDEEAHEKQILSLAGPDHPELIRVIRLPERTGLIYAKMLGAQQAKGDVVMFFEPHCIVGKHWLEPLLHVMNQKPNSLVLPTLDYIPQEDFAQYNKAVPGRYRFEWNFNLIYTNPDGITGEHDKPYYAPATSGGIFAIKKARFLELNLFDVGMKQWGGDQIELSFKAWRCGGSIVVVPCSRVGHLFRDVAHRPYPVDIPQVVENYAKLARVWLEPPFLDAFYLVKPESRRMALAVDLSTPRGTMSKLKCKSMKWYVENVDLELGWEADKICIPGARGPIGCEKPAYPGRATIDRIIPPQEYQVRALKSKFMRPAKFKKSDKEQQMQRGGR